LNKQTDNRKNMPKLNCPYCGKRCADVPNKDYKNASQLVTIDNIGKDDYILECPHCHKKMGLHIEHIYYVTNLKPVPVKGYVNA